MPDRYARSKVIRKGKKAARTPSVAARLIYEGVTAGTIPVQLFILSEGQRLDIVAANFYGDPGFWWVIAAASGIGWQCQVPPGTQLKIPTSAAQIQQLVG